MKAVVIIFIVVILLTLGSALLALLKGGKQGSDKLFKSLATRVGLSVALFVLLMFAGLMGWIRPHGILPMSRLEMPPPVPSKIPEFNQEKTQFVR